MTDILEHISLSHPRFVPTTPLRSRRNWWRRLVLRWQIMRDARATRRALEQLDDRLLKDIGLGAHDIWLRSRAERPSERHFFDL